MGTHNPALIDRHSHKRQMKRKMQKLQKVNGRTWQMKQKPRLGQFSFFSSWLLSFQIDFTSQIFHRYAVISLWSLPASTVHRTSLSFPVLTQTLHCCSEPVKSARLGCTLAYPPPADPDRLAPAVSKSELSVWCRPSLFPIKTLVFSSNCLCGRVFVSRFFWEWYSPHDWRRLSFIVLCKTF